MPVILSERSERRTSRKRTDTVARGFGEILRRLACGGPPQDDEGYRGDFLDNLHSPRHTTDDESRRAGGGRLSSAPLPLCCMWTFERLSCL